MSEPERNTESEVKVVRQLMNTNETVNVGNELTSEQITELMQVLQRNIAAFSINGSLGETHLAEHVIELLPDTKPVAEPLRRRAQIPVRRDS